MLRLRDGAFLTSGSGIHDPYNNIYPDVYAGPLPLYVSEILLYVNTSFPLSKYLGWSCEMVYSLTTTTNNHGSFS